MARNECYVPQARVLNSREEFVLRILTNRFSAYAQDTLLALVTGTEYKNGKDLETLTRWLSLSVKVDF